MKQIHGWLRATTILSALAISATASATTGYFALGYGAKSMGMAGAVVSNPQDTISAAANPASIGLLAEGWDVGMRFFSPIRDGKISTSVVGAGTDFGPAFDVEDESRRNLFLIPSIGITKALSNRLTIGFNIYGNGGLNSTYDINIYDQTAAVLFNPAGPNATPPGVGTPTPQTGKLGVDLAQSIQALSLAYKANDAHTVGASLLIGVQRFSARGLGNFSCLTSSVQNAVPPDPTCPTTGYPTNPSTTLTDNNSDWAYGAGVRVGWIGQLTPAVTLGAAVASKVYMTEFDDYSELFAEQGDLDIPANFAVGVTVKATPKLNVSFDFQRILYEGVNSISNAGPVPTAGGPFYSPPTTGPLGDDNGLGFGWEDINIYRLAFEYMHNSQWTYRAGFAINDQPIGSDDVTFNILAPAVIEKHATIGFSYMPDKTSSWNFGYMHAFEEEVSTSTSAFGVPASISMYQNSLDLSYSKKF